MDKKRITKKAVIRELMTGVSARAINEGDVDETPFKKIQKAIRSKDPKGGELLAAFVGGMALGSDAVARRWIERNPASALAYSIGPDAGAKLLKAKSATV